MQGNISKAMCNFLKHMDINAGNPSSSSDEEKRTCREGFTNYKQIQVQSWDKTDLEDNHKKNSSSSSISSKPFPTKKTDYMRSAIR